MGIVVARSKVLHHGVTKERAMKRLVLLTSIAFMPWAGSPALAAQVGSSCYECGSSWYRPVYAGTSVQYIVVTAP